MGTVQVYDPRKNAWTDAPDLPTARTHLAAATDLDGRIYAIGGRSGSSNQPTDIVEVYTPSSGSWSTGKPLPSAMGDPSAARGTDGRIYVLDAKTLAIYDPGSDSWSTAGAPPSGNRAPVLTALPDGRILAAGGIGAGGGSAARAATDVFAYTPGSKAAEKGSWAQMSDLPDGVAGAAGATGPDGRVYIIGGRDSAGNVTGAVQVYTPKDDRWAAGPTSSPSTRAGHAAATGGDGRVYVLGGTSSSGKTLNTVAALSK